MRLQQTCLPNPKVPIEHIRIAGTEAEGLFQERDALSYRPDQDLASALIGQCARRVMIESNRRRVFADGVRASVLHAQDLCFRVVCIWISRSLRQGSICQCLSPFYV